MSTEFEAIRRSDAVSSKAIDTIKKMIAQGDLGPGQRLPAERDLASRLGVSRPSLREAIRALVSLNILESRHGDGTFVSSLELELLAEPIDFVLQVNKDSLSALFEARQVLEAGTASLAAERATDLELAHLEVFVRQARGGIDSPEVFIEHDMDFHERVSKAAKSPILSSMLGSIRTLAYVGRKETAKDATLRARALTDHENVVKALKARNPQAAYDAMSAHLKRSGAIAVKALDREKARLEPDGDGAALLDGTE